MDEYRTGTGQLIYTHTSDKCAGDFCVIHNPSDHPMIGFKTHWRADKELMERICFHGIGHPDPDHLAFSNKSWEGVHGCDGCCSKKLIQGSLVTEKELN